MLMLHVVKREVIGSPGRRDDPVWSFLSHQAKISVVRANILDTAGSNLGVKMVTALTLET